MTESEAIQQFKERIAIPDYKEQIPEYYEAMELAIKALENQIQKKQKSNKVIYSNDSYSYCPSCKKCIKTVYSRICDNCGQKLDWSDEE